MLLLSLNGTDFRASAMYVLLKIVDAKKLTSVVSQLIKYICSDHITKIYDMEHFHVT